MGVLEGSERESGLREVLNETIIEDFLIMEKDFGNKTQEGQRTLNRAKWKWAFPKHIIIKHSLVEYKESILYTCMRKVK